MKRARAPGEDALQEGPVGILRAGEDLGLSAGAGVAFAARERPAGRHALSTKADAELLLSQTSAQEHGLVSEAFAAAGAHGYHYRLLAALAEFGPGSQATLGRRTRIDRSDVVASLNELADRGLVTRAPDSRDRRQNVITITSAGTAQLRRLDHVVPDVQDELLWPLSGAERQLLIGLLTRVLEHHASR